MSRDRPTLSGVLQALDDAEIHERSVDRENTAYTLTLDGGEQVDVSQAVLFSPTQLQRAVAPVLGTVPVNDYPERDAEAGGVHALEDDLSEHVLPKIDRGDE